MYKLYLIFQKSAAWIREHINPKKFMAELKKEAVKKYLTENYRQPIPQDLHRTIYYWPLSELRTKAEADLKMKIEPEIFKSALVELKWKTILRQRADQKFTWNSLPLVQIR